MITGQRLTRKYFIDKLKYIIRCLGLCRKDFSDLSIRRGSASTSASEKIPEYLGRVKRIWYLSPMRAAKVQASLRIRAVSPEPPLLAHTSSESRGTFRQKTKSLAPLNG